MDHYHDLLNAVLESPDDDTPRLVFADYLDETGDRRRATFIRQQIEFAFIAKNKGKNAERYRELAQEIQSIPKVMPYKWLRDAGILVSSFSTKPLELSHDYIQIGFDTIAVKVRFSRGWIDTVFAPGLWVIQNLKALCQSPVSKFLVAYNDAGHQIQFDWAKKQIQFDWAKNHETGKWFADVFWSNTKRKKKPILLKEWESRDESVAGLTFWMVNSIEAYLKYTYGKNYYSEFLHDIREELRKQQEESE